MKKGLSAKKQPLFIIMPQQKYNEFFLMNRLLFFYYIPFKLFNHTAVTDDVITINKKRTASRETCSPFLKLILLK
jgi:hypothetical protein